MTKKNICNKEHGTCGHNDSCLTKAYQLGKKDGIVSNAIISNNPVYIKLHADCRIQNKNNKLTGKIFKAIPITKTIIKGFQIILNEKPLLVPKNVCEIIPIKKSYWYKIKKNFQGGMNFYYASMPKGYKIKKGCWDYQLEEWGKLTSGGHNYGYNITATKIKQPPKKYKIYKFFNILKFNMDYLEEC